MSTQSKIRVILRWVHIVLGLILMCYVYSPFGKIQSFQIAVKFVVIPVATFTGLWIWKFRAFNQFFKITE
jgi:hypothetical protein